MYRKKLTGKRVVVRTAGTAYEGVMVEMNDTSVLLRADTGHREIEMSQIVSIEESTGAGPSVLSPSPLGPKR